MRGSQGMPFHGDDNPYVTSAKYVDIVAEVMNGELAFHRMSPHDFALTDHDPLRVWCLAEPGRQYLTFATAGEPFTLHLAAGEYVHNVWIDTKTGRSLRAPETRVSPDEVSAKKAAIMPDERRVGTKGIPFVPPDNATDWVLLLRTAASPQLSPPATITERPTKP